MPKLEQNVVFFIEPTDDTYNISLKAGNMLLNQFCIDEDAAVEISGVNYLLKKCSRKFHNSPNDALVLLLKKEIEERAAKEKEYYHVQKFEYL